jgi:TolA-binding protein
VLKDYSGGNKAPDAFLRTGYCFEILGKNSKALEIFEEVTKKYPGTAVADKAEDKISLLSIR